MDNQIYFDNAATTKLDEEVLKAMMPYLTNSYGNPSSLHASGREGRMAVEESRKKIASLLGVKPQNIIFTSGGTESNNMAILSSIRDLKCDHIITSKIEHHAVLNTIEFYAKMFEIEVSYVKLYEDGSIDQNDFRRILETKAKEGYKCLVSLMHANNETGNFTEISWVSSLCKKHGAIFHSDCVQTIGHYPVNLSRMKLHMASASAHKFHGPKGIGILYLQDDLSVSSLIFGGAQERNYRAGTENVASIVGMAKALQGAQQSFQRHQFHITELKQYLEARLKEEFPGIITNSGKHSLYSTLSVSFPKSESSEMLLMELDMKGIFVSGGSACSGGDSHVMKELGKTKNYVTIRFSFSKYNTKDEIDRTVEVLQEILQTQQSSVAVK